MMGTRRRLLARWANVLAILFALAGSAHSDGLNGTQPATWLEQAEYAQPGCGVPLSPRHIVDGKLRALVAARTFFVGKESLQ